MVVGGLVVAVVILGLIWFVRVMMTAKIDKPKRETAQIVKLIRPPPPPPEPPPPPPPPEEKIDEPLPQDTPTPEPAQDEAPPAAESLGLDAEGVAGADGFGLAARKGGRELLSGGGSAFAWYTSMLKDSIVNVLSEDERIRRGSYQVTVRVWLSRTGDVEKIKLASTSGDRELDRAIERSLEKMAKVREAPPIEMPQPITLRILSRG
jgi:periplasmic protein TonB